MQRILAIDPGVHCGWAVMVPGWTAPEFGTRTFDMDRGEDRGIRFLRFRHWIEEYQQWGVNLFIYEEPHQRGGYTTDLLKGMKAHIQAEASRVGAVSIGLHSGTLKKFACGKGNAKKPDMLMAARSTWNLDDMQTLDEHQADALMLLDYARKKL